MVLSKPAQTTFNIFTEKDLRTNKTRQLEISKEMHEEISAALRGHGLVVKRYNICINGHDLNCLKGQTWLNDKVIEFYMKLIADQSLRDIFRRERMPTVYAMSPYFFQSLMRCGPNAMERWTKNKNIFDFDLILVPIHLEVHWCLATVDFRIPAEHTKSTQTWTRPPVVAALKTVTQLAATQMTTQVIRTPTSQQMRMSN